MFADIRLTDSGCTRTRRLARPPNQRACHHVHSGSNEPLQTDFKIMYPTSTAVHHLLTPIDERSRFNL
ncbi:hypothetical protein AWV80_15615 [Cupriavidus sp. UYMU48A]|nr:hypothetical protein AWV80_15615 [Cupriavidus sp. UYMU48A]